MTYCKLPYSAHAILQTCQHLDNPILLYHGGSGKVDERPAFASLCFGPSAQLVAYSPADVIILRDQLEQAMTSVTPISSPMSADASTPMKGHFRSGWAGFWGYDACQILALSGPSDSLATANTHSRTTPSLPMAYFGYYPCVVELHEVTDEVWLHNPLGLSEHELQPWLSALKETALAIQPHSTPVRHLWQALWHKQDYQHAFTKVHDYLAAGDCYQVNLAMPFVHSGDLRDRAPLPLLRAFDAPFSAYCRLAELTLFSVSPERFIRIQDRQLQTKPIKGTTPRATDPQQDNENRLSLRNSAKNQAENVMIVDLLRNDLSRSALPHSVRVDALFAIESHANVHHMVSTISAQLADHQSPFNAIVQALPGGSITGAPKRRAMEIISELEPRSRGAYCGSLGYFDDGGHCDFNILIRTICATATEAVCWGGGGVVMDSTVDDEYQEIFNKVQKILDAEW